MQNSHRRIRRAKLYDRIAGGLLWMLVVLWAVVLLLWAFLHAYLVPRIEQYRPWLQEQASATLGLRIEVASLGAEAQGLVVVVRMNDIRLFDRSGQARLDLQRVTLALTPISLLQGQFTQIALSHLDVEVRRDRQGRVSVAGIPLQGEDDDARLRNWVFSQGEWVIQNSRVRWVNEAASGSPLVVSQIEGVLRNRLGKHHFQIDGTPDSGLGQRFSLRGHFSQPLFSPQSGRWEEWSGQAFYETSDLNWQLWAQRLGLPEPALTASGQGWLRVWMDTKKGQLSKLTADAGLNHLEARVTGSGPRPEIVKLRAISGRWAWSSLGAESRITTDQAVLIPWQGPPWALGQSSLQLKQSAAGEIESGQLSIEYVDLESLQSLMSLAPERWASIWAQAAPSGSLSQVEWRWQGPVQAMQIQNWKARVERLSVRAGPPGGGAKLAAWPGISGMSANLKGSGWELKNSTIKVQDGELHWPGLWEQPVRKIKHFQADLSAQHNPSGNRVQLQSAALNADAVDVNLDIEWNNTASDPLGRIDLRSQVPVAQAAQILSWLPTVIPDAVRQYLKLALPEGEARDINARVLGRLQDFPFTKAESGEFSIKGQISKFIFKTMPQALQDAKTSGEWPTLQNLSAELVFERNAIFLNKVKARLAEAPDIVWPVLNADIRNLDQEATVHVRAEGHGPLGQALNWWQGSPLHGWTQQALHGGWATGTAAYRFTLAIPVDHSGPTQIKGALQLQGNDLKLSTLAPVLNQTRGTLLFDADGFDLQAVAANLWGGDIQIEGGGKFNPLAGQSPVQIRAQGTLSAAGMRAAPELAGWTQHLNRLQGTAAYSARLQWRRGTLESQLKSDLVGLSIAAPAGLGKAATDAMALSLENRLQPTLVAAPGVLHEEIWLRLGQEWEARFLRDLAGKSPKVLRGLIRWGQGTAKELPRQGVALRVQTDLFKLNEWTDLFRTAPTATGQTSLADGFSAYEPQSIELQVRQLQYQSWKTNQVVFKAQLQGEQWQGQVSGQDVEGEVKYSPVQKGLGPRLQARLARLSIPASDLPSAPNPPDSALQDWPTMDIQVKDLVVSGKRLGAFVLQADQGVAKEGGYEWRMHKVQITNDAGELSGEGLWHQPVGQAHRQTQFDFQLNIKNAGLLLQYLGTPDAVRAGQGSIKGRLVWQGSPVAPNYDTMNGQFQVGIERGQFLKTDPGAARFLGILSLQSLTRRLTLDFRDVFSEGFAFDFFRGDVRVDNGVAQSKNLEMKGVNIAVLMEGQANIAQETQSLKVLVVPDINFGSAALLYSAINPLVGLSTFITQYVLRNPLSESNTKQFQIEGTWQDPQVTKIPYQPPVKP